MNQIQSSSVDPRVVKIAKDLVGDDNVCTALSLIEFDPKYSKVMEFVFGKRLICTTLDVAKKVTFHRDILTYSVTLDGDTFDPEGTLTGGSRQERQCILLKLNELHNDIKQLEAKRVELTKLQAKFESVKNESVKYNSLKRDLDKEMNQLNVAKSVLEQNSHHQKLEKFNILKTEISNLLFYFKWHFFF